MRHFVSLMLATVLLGGTQAFAGGVPSKCEIKVTDLKTKESSVTPFEATIGEEELTTKTVEIKKIKRVATGRVYYTDEWVGIRWPDEHTILDISATIRLDVDKKAKSGNFPAAGEGSQTRVILSDFSDLKSMDVCEKALKDEAYAKSIAPGGNLPILLDTCKAFVENKGVNTLSVSKTEKGQLVELSCKE